MVTISLILGNNDISFDIDLLTSFSKYPSPSLTLSQSWKLKGRSERFAAELQENAACDGFKDETGRREGLPRVRPSRKETRRWASVYWPFSYTHELVARSYVILARLIRFMPTKYAWNCAGVKVSCGVAQWVEDVHEWILKVTQQPPSKHTEIGLRSANEKIDEETRFSKTSDLLLLPFLWLIIAIKEIWLRNWKNCNCVHVLLLLLKKQNEGTPI